MTIELGMLKPRSAAIAAELSGPLTAWLAQLTSAGYGISEVEAAMHKAWHTMVPYGKRTRLEFKACVQSTGRLFMECPGDVSRLLVDGNPDPGDGYRLYSDNVQSQPTAYHACGLSRAANSGSRATKIDA